MTEARAQTGPPAGPTLGRYHLAEAIGGGPTGEVFRAKVYGVAGFERQFAIKRFYKALCDDPTRLGMLAEAARRYQTIEHPRIARLHEYGVIEGQAFVAVELVPGIDLARFIAFTHGLGQPIPPGAALGLLAQLARAVAYAQGRGVLHTGICPTNVVVTPDGDVKVMDFGFIRARLPDKPADDWSLAARLPYLSPEQLRGGATSPATDVFQLATLAHELLSGRRAFEAPTPPEIAARVASGQTTVELMPAGVSDVLARAHAPRPEDRWSNAGAFADYLEAAVRRTPQTGGRSDVAAAVRRAVQRSLELEAQQVSGALSFPLPSPPPSLTGLAPHVPLRTPAASTASAGSTANDAPTRVGSDPAAIAKSAVPDLSLEPEPVSEPTSIPVPSTLPAATPPPVSVTPPPAPPSVPLGATILGVAPPSMPLPPPEPTMPGEPVSSRAPSVPDLPELELGEEDEVHTGVHVPAPPASQAATGAQPIMSTSAPPAPTRPMSAPEGVADASPAPPTGIQPQLAPDDMLTTARPKVRKRGGGGALRALLVVLLFAAAGAGGYVAFRKLAADRTSVAQGDGARPKVAPVAAVDAGAATPLAARPGAADAGAVAVTPPTPLATAADAAPVAVAPGPPDAGEVAAMRPPDPPPVPSGTLRFESDPPGALVYIDGAQKGKTPFELPATGDKHKVALVKKGHKLWRGDVDGSGLVRQTLAPASLSEGAGRIKVRCKTKNRLYIIVNGQDTGELCPSERIYTPLGEITLELYDPVNDTSNTHKVVVKPSSGSQRVRLPD